MYTKETCIARKNDSIKNLYMYMCVCVCVFVGSVCMWMCVCVCVCVYEKKECKPENN